MADIRDRSDSTDIQNRTPFTTRLEEKSRMQQQIEQEARSRKIKEDLKAAAEAAGLTPKLLDWVNAGRPKVHFREPQYGGDAYYTDKWNCRIDFNRADTAWLKENVGES